MKLREEYEAKLKPPYPWTNKEILWDEEDAFCFIGTNGVVVGFNRNTETFWRRHQPDDTETGDV